MRSIPSEALAVLASQEAIEPIIIVEVTWGDDSSTSRLYADKDLDVDGVKIEGRIVELGAFDDVMKTDQSGAAAQVSVKLSDLDGALKGIFDASDIHKRPVKLFQYFIGLPLSTKFLILDGQLSTPFEWEEGKRTFAFDVVTKLEDYEIGFSADEGNFPLVPVALVGTPWPMLFGYVLHYPGLQLTEIPSAFTTAAFGVPDPSLGAEIGTINSHVTALHDAAQACINAAIAACWNEVWEGSLNGQSIFDIDCNDSPDVKRYNDQAVQLQEQANQEKSQVTELLNRQSEQEVWRRGSVPLKTQTNVTQPFSGVLRLGNQMFHGSISGRTGVLNCTPLITQPISVNGDPTVDVQTVIQPTGFNFYNSGTQVQISGPYPITFVVSIVPGTVHQVWSYRSINGLKQLVPVPSSYYSVTTLTMGTVSAICVVLNQPLSSINFTQNLGVQNWENAFGQYLPPHIVPQVDWEDQIYVTFESSVGPNTCDIIQYFVNTYATGLTCDSTTFAAVAVQLEKYPMDFGIASRENVISVISELAYQARCALFIKNSVVYIKYLPAEEDEVDTITESNIENDSLMVGCTPTEELITKYVATFRPDYTPTYNEPVQAIFRYNVKKYGVHEDSHDFYAYRDFYEVQKSATFWMIRRANTYKLLRCKLMLAKLNLETFDTVLLNFSHPYIASGAVKALVNSARYNSSDNTIDAEFWVPVRLGEMKKYDFAWPAGLVENNFFPVISDVTAGASGGINGHVVGVLPPSNGLRIDVAPIPTGGQQALSNGFYQNDNLDTTPVIPDVELEPLPIEEPIMGKYTYPVLKDPTVVPVPTGTATYPCTVDEFKGFTDAGLQSYSCTAYPSGTVNTGKTLAVVGQLQIDRDDRIPPGTWAHVVVVSWKEGENIKRQATIQVPVWLK